MAHQHNRRGVIVALTIFAIFMTWGLAACDSASGTAPTAAPTTTATSTPAAAASAQAPATATPLHVAAALSTATASPTSVQTGTSTPIPPTLTTTPQAAATTAATTGTGGGLSPFRRTPGPTGTTLPTVAPQPGFPTETTVPDYLSWARPGPYRSPYQAQFNLESFKSTTPLVTTIFFYWFDFAGKMGGAPEQPVTSSPITVMPSYANSITFVDSAWYEKEFNEDLTTTRGKEIFYATIRDFYARIPPAHWAAIDNKPVVWLYDAQKVGNFDQSSFDYVYEHFANDFGGMRPYIVREWQWYQARGTSNDVLKTEGLYGWGAAPFGINVDTRFTVAEVGPGFGQNQFGGRDPIYTDRESGKYYEGNLKSALRSRRKILSIETWNEYDEATGISETVEWGRQYIDLTRKYVNLFKAGKIP